MRLGRWYPGAIVVTNPHGMGEACSEGCRLLWQGVVVVASGPFLLMSVVIEQRDVQSSARLMRKELNGGGVWSAARPVCVARSLGWLTGQGHTGLLLHELGRG